MNKRCILLTAVLLLFSCNKEISLSISEEINSPRPYALPFTQHRTSFQERSAQLQTAYDKRLAPHLAKYEDSLRTIITKHLPLGTPVEFNREVKFTYIGVSNEKMYGEAELYKHQKGIVLTALIIVGEMPLDSTGSAHWTIQPRGWIEE